MVAQIPIIASRVGGIPEIIHDGKNGLLVEAKKSKLLTEKILYLIKNKAVAKKLAFLGRFSVEDFDIKKMVLETEKLYDHLLSP